MAIQDDSPAEIRVARALKGLKQGELAREARIDPSALSRHEKEGADAPPLDVKSRIAAAAGATPAFFEGVVAAYRVFETAPKGSEAASAELTYELAGEVASRFAALLAPALAVLSIPDTPALETGVPPTAKDRAEAESLFLRLVPHTPAERLVIVTKGRGYRSAALCERLCAESVNAAARNGEDSLHWSKLALRVAERIPGSEAQRTKALGYAWAFVGNARRVANKFPAVDEAFARSRALFDLGRETALGWFDEARALDLEASLCRDLGDFGRALALLDLALARCESSSRARLLLIQAATYEQSGDPARALAALQAAEPAIDGGEGGIRFRWMLQFNRVNLLRSEHPAEAEAQLAELRGLAAELNNELDTLRLRWLEAAVQADLGHRAEALAAMAAVRAEFASRSLPADAALVGLHEAEILLLDERTTKVRALVRAMGPIFESLGLKREALAAYRLFVAAVERETATAAMARELAKAIERAGAFAS